MIPVLRYAGSWTPAALQSAGRTASFSRERNNARNLLVVAQVAMALVLLVSAALMIRTFQKLRTIDPGFGDAAHLETMRISIPDSLIGNPQMTTRLQNDIIDKVAAIPGVTSVGFAGAMPMEGIEIGWDDIFAEGKSYPGETAPLRLFNHVSPGFFRTAKTRIVAGREFTWPEVYNRLPVVIVSENLARELWGSPTAAIGKRIRRWNSSPWTEVIGVVQNIYQNGVQETAPTIVYWPAMAVGYWGPGTFDATRSAIFIVRSDRAGTESFLSELRQAVWSLNSNVAVASMRTMQDIYGQSLARTSFTLVMLGIAGAMALVLGFVGIYGVISYAVSQRTREIGIRLALGAERAKISRMVIGQGLRLALAGVVVGAVATVVLGRSLSSFSQLLYGVRVTNPAILAAVSFAVVIVAVVACYLPARRAASVEPMKALRSE